MAQAAKKKLWRLYKRTRQSVAVQRDGASRMAKIIPIIALGKCIFELFCFTQKMAITPWKTTVFE